MPWIAVFVALATWKSCEPLIASVESALIRPAPTLKIWRFSPFLPTEILPLPSVFLTPFLATSLPSMKRSATESIFASSWVSDSWPNATELACFAFALRPIATPLFAWTDVFEPNATASSAITPVPSSLIPTEAWWPIATLL